MNSLEEIRLPNTVCPPIPKKDVEIVEGEKEWFVRGPIPGLWISKASSLPGNHTLHVALAIWYVKGLSGSSNKIILDRFHFDRFNVGIDSTRRALERLQEAGLIEYKRVGHKHKVTILSVRSETMPETNGLISTVPEEGQDNHVPVKDKEHLRTEPPPTPTNTRTLETITAAQQVQFPGQQTENTDRTNAVMFREVQETIAKLTASIK